MKHHRQHQFGSNSRIGIIFALGFVLVISSILMSGIGRSKVISAVGNATSTAIPSSKASTSAVPSNISSSSPFIAPDLVDDIKMPSHTASMNIEASVQPIIQQDPAIPRGDCENIIQPTEVGEAKLGVYQCTNKPFTSPSTHQTSTVVLAGHQSVNHYWNTVFDHLSCTANGCGPYLQTQGCRIQKAALTNRSIFLHTEDSGQFWFEYTITDVVCPSKNATQDLSMKEQLWRPTAGRLLLVTCLEQQGLTYGASDNLIVEAQYDRLTQNPF